MTQFQYDWHPAVYSKPILEHFDQIIDDRLFRKGDKPPINVLDPFAGTGKIHTLARPGLVSAVGVEIQEQYVHPEMFGIEDWVADPNTVLGDATDLAKSWTGLFHMVMTSPTYGNRFSDRHQAKDASKRRGYTHDLRRMTGDPALELHPSNTGRYAFHTKQYQELHAKAWREVWRVLRPGGWFVLNVSDVIKGGEVVDVAQWHHDLVTDIGFNTVKIIPVETRRLRYGRNSAARAAYEMIYVLEKL